MSGTNQHFGRIRNWNRISGTFLHAKSLSNDIILGLGLRLGIGLVCFFSGLSSRNLEETLGGDVPRPDPSSSSSSWPLTDTVSCTSSTCETSKQHLSTSHNTTSFRRAWVIVAVLTRSPRVTCSWMPRRSYLLPVALTRASSYVVSFVNRIKWLHTMPPRHLRSQRICRVDELKN